MEFKIGTGLACVGIAVAIGQWLIPPDTVSYDVRFVIVIFALVLFIAGLGLWVHATWHWWRAPHELTPRHDLIVPAQNATDLAHKSVRLTVEYDEGQGSFYQESPIHRPGLGRGVLQLYRLRVRSLLPVNDVQVKAQRVIPEQQDLLGLPCHLQRMNDNVQPSSRSTTFTKGQEEYFDIAGYARFMLHTGDLHLRRIDGAAGHIAEEPCNLLVRVTGMGIDPIDRWFRLEIDSNNNLHMSLLQQNPDNVSETIEFISMKDAAMQCYAEARTSQFIMKQAEEEMRENIPHGSPEDDLHYMARYIATKIPVYGRRGDASNERERINSICLYAFKQEATRLEHKFYPTSADGVFMSVEVRRDQAQALIAEMQMESGFHDKWKS